MGFVAFPGVHFTSHSGGGSPPGPDEWKYALVVFYIVACIVLAFKKISWFTGEDDSWFYPYHSYPNWSKAYPVRSFIFDILFCPLWVVVGIYYIIVLIAYVWSIVYYKTRWMD